MKRAKLAARRKFITESWFWYSDGEDYLIEFDKFFNSKHLDKFDEEKRIEIFSILNACYHMGTSGLTLNELSLLTGIKDVKLAPIIKDLVSNRKLYKKGVGGKHQDSPLYYVAAAHSFGKKLRETRLETGFNLYSRDIAARNREGVIPSKTQNKAMFIKKKAVINNMLEEMGLKDLVEDVKKEK